MSTSRSGSSRGPASHYGEIWEIAADLAPLDHRAHRPRQDDELAGGVRPASPHDSPDTCWAGTPSLRSPPAIA
jgi:hypothetical protein